MKGNFEIQAEIDISLHPEWSYEEKYKALISGKGKDIIYQKTFRECKMQLFELIEEMLYKYLTIDPLYNQFVELHTTGVDLSDYINEPIWRQPITIRHKEEPEWETLVFKQN